MNAAVPRPVPGPPARSFDSIRDFIRALDERGRVLHVESMDQDKYEVTAFAYRLIDKFGIEHAPAFMVDRIRINGNWMEGPLVANPYGRWPDEAVLFGVPEITGDYQQMYHAVLKAMETRLDAAGNWQRIPPRELDARRAPCKQVILRGDDINIGKFAWLKNNPADAGRYINITSVIMDDAEFGKNTGTYRCQVRDGRRISINPEPSQHGWRILTAMRKRGDKVAHVAIAVGADPFTFCASSTKMAGFREDELEFAGGLRGSALEVVKCETSHIRVPAHAEMIIEGEVPLDEGLDEGPYGEMYGYLGPMKPNNFFMNIKCITHREKPWILNSFTGLTCDMPRAPQIASNYFRYRQLIPNLTGLYSPRGANGVIVISIDKKLPGEGMAAGQYLAANIGLNKVVIVVDKDINILEPSQILHALGARWQPSASLLIPQTQMMMPDPSRRHWALSSKMIIDATRQLESEGGPKAWAPLNRDLLVKGAPDSFPLVDGKWDEYLKGWDQP
ncbi:MAG: UbiD family decarboxylase [Gammaproteobacteria bacterium]|nr:UbiD family decarboxylase [Gammaproteobacteria bacterium]MDH5274836.1 UbiD family decarboxylase [Gammaproteobacteria bacterium]